jgi:hypothetical protein
MAATSLIYFPLYTPLTGYGIGESSSGSFVECIITDQEDMISNPLRDRHWQANLKWKILESAFLPVLRIWDPGSGAFLTPGSGIRDE